MRFSRALSATAVVVVVALIGSVLVAGAAAPQSAKPKAADVGITDKEIRLAVIADVENPVVPGLFQPSVDAVKAWAKLVNKQGGLAGRKVVIDFIDSKLSADEARNAVIKACSDDFAMVGSAALFLNNVDDMVACADAQGNPTGLPDVPGLALEVPQRCSPVTYVFSGDRKFCATQDQHPQTYFPQAGDARYYLKKHKDLHGIWLVPSDLRATRNAQITNFQAGFELGMKKDGEGFYDNSARAPQSALTPFVQVMKDNNSTFAYNGNAFNQMVLLRREAKLQGVNSVKVWACNQGCYDAEFLKQGGADVEGTSSWLPTLPFYSEYKQNAALKGLVRELGGADQLNANAINSYVGALLFQEAAEKAVAGGGTLTRQSLLDSLKSIHKFDAQGIIGPMDIGNREPNPCYVLVTVKNGKFVRTNPTKPGTFDCNTKNIKEVKMDLL
jgi:ABC-type branched-subunit amino acid transport system substrate-binding protein